MRKNLRPRSKLIPAQNGIAEILGQERYLQLATISKLRRIWPDIVGPMMAARTEPVSIEQDGNIKCLFIAVDHPIMSQQIRFLRDDIRKACFKRLRIESLGKVRTRVQPDAGMKAEKRVKVASKVTLFDKKRVALELKTIKDRALKHAMFDARIAQLKFNSTPEETS